MTNSDCEILFVRNVPKDARKNLKIFCLQHNLRMGDVLAEIFKSAVDSSGNMNWNKVIENVKTKGGSK